MNIAFRTDASEQIGTGHFMRCLTLAIELKKNYGQIIFISRNLPRHLIDMLNTNGMIYFPLKTGTVKEATDELAHANWLGTSQVQDAQYTIQALDNKNWDYIIVDHYALDERWEKLVRVKCKKLLVIDDIADRKHVCDILLDQNYYSNINSRYIGKVPENCKLLLGPKYALLREEFKFYRNKIKIRTGEVKNILIFFGGVDLENYTSLTIQILSELKFKQQVNVVIGADHLNQEQIKKACIENGYEYHVQTTRMAELMSKSDFGIGAAGSASWERCCLGLPTLLLTLAANQIEIAKALNSINACYYVENNNIKNIKHALQKLLNKPSHIHSISEQAFLLVDGWGSNRVCEELG